jgi:outer membrane protein TolC
MKQAEVNLEVVKSDYMRIKNDLILQVRKAYYTLAKAKENLKLQEDLHREVSNIYDMVERAFEAGLVARLELLNITSQTSQVRYQLTSASGDIAVSDLILKQAMYMDSAQKIDIAPRLEFRKIDLDFDRILFTALVNRPEMKINSYMLEYYRYEKKISNAKGWWPKIDILGSWGLAMEEYTAKDNQIQMSNGQPFQDAINVKPQEQWYGGFKVSLPIWGSTVEYSYTREQWVPVVSAYQGTEASTNTVSFKLLDNMKSISEMQSADVDFERARQELAKAQNDVTLDVRESFFNYQKAVMQYDTASSKMEYQAKDLEAVRAKREMDEAQDSNVVDSLIKLAQEKFGYVQALTDYYIALAAINKAVGMEDYIKTGE